MKKPDHKLTEDQRNFTEHVQYLMSMFAFFCFVGMFISFIIAAWQNYALAFKMFATCFILIVLFAIMRAALKSMVDEYDNENKKTE